MTFLNFLIDKLQFLVYTISPAADSWEEAMNPANHDMDTINRTLLRVHKLLTVQHRKLERWREIDRAKLIGEALNSVVKVLNANGVTIVVKSLNTMPTINSSAMQSDLPQAVMAYTAAFKHQELFILWEQYLDVFNKLNENEQEEMFRRAVEISESNPPWGYSEATS